MIFYRPILFALATCLWLGGMGYGLVKMFNYSATAGQLAAAPAHLPAGTRLVAPAGKFLLQVFVHPECPCSKATLGELESLLPRFGSKVIARIVFVSPKGYSGKIEATSLWHQAQGLPGVVIYHDKLGQEAERFGAKTSGQIFLYSENGDLLFSGGITPSRGHRGENLGSLQLLAALSGESRLRAKGRVFGCSLQGEEHRLAVKQ